MKKKEKQIQFRVQIDMLDQDAYYYYGEKAFHSFQFFFLFIKLS